MSRVLLTYADALSTYLSWQVEGSSTVRTARLRPEQTAAIRESFPRSLPDATGTETQEEALHRTFHEGAFSSPELTRTYLGQLADLLIPAEVIHLLRSLPDPELVIRPSPTVAPVPWAVLPTRPHGHLLGEIAHVSLGVPASVAALADAGAAPVARADHDLRIIDPKIPGHPPGGPLGSVLGRPVDTDPLAVLLGPETLPAADSYARLARAHVTAEAFLDYSERARTLLFVGHVSAAGAATASAESSTLHLSTAVTAGDLLRAGWRAPARVGLLGCGSGTDLRYPEPFGLASAALASGARTVIASLWTLPTEAALDTGDRHPLRDLVLATDRALHSADPVRALTGWQIARAQAWFAEGHPGDNPAWWAAPVIWHRDRRAVPGPGD